jgi:hypothetical protein
MTEFPLAFWLEKEGYDVTYISNVDTHADAKGLLRAKAFLSVGHDEYWTERMFENVTRARDAGVSLAFLSGNSISGVVELLPSSDGRPNRVMRRAGRGFQGEQELMGSTSYGVGFADWTSDTPEHWVFEGTNMKKGDRVAQLVGWEYHGAPLGKHPISSSSRKGRSTAPTARSAPAPTPRPSTPQPKATWCSTPAPAGGTWCCRRHRDSRIRRAGTSVATTSASSGLRRTSSTG